MDDSSLIKPGDPEWDVTIEDGVLKIPKRESFGWEYFKTNSILTKLHYLCGIYCCDITEISGKKNITKLKKILKNLFGVRDVEFAWAVEYRERLKEVEDPEEAYWDYPEIDHNSHDIFEEITENIEVIRHYLFSRNSWLYGGNDNSDSPEGFYNESEKRNKEPKAILSLDLGGDFGRVDWEVIRFPLSDRSLFREIFMYDECGILGNLVYDVEEKKFIPFNESMMNRIKELGHRFLSFGQQHGFIDSKILYTSHRFGDELKALEEKAVESHPECKYMTSDERYDACLTLLDKLEPGIDYVALPVHLKLLEYNGYEI